MKTRIFMMLWFRVQSKKKWSAINLYNGFWIPFITLWETGDMGERFWKGGENFSWDVLSIWWLLKKQGWLWVNNEVVNSIGKKDIWLINGNLAH